MAVAGVPVVDVLVGVPAMLVEVAVDVLVDVPATDVLVEVEVEAGVPAVEVFVEVELEAGVSVDVLVLAGVFVGVTADVTSIDISSK